MQSYDEWAKARRTHNKRLGTDNLHPDSRHPHYLPVGFGQYVDEVIIPTLRTLDERQARDRRAEVAAREKIRRRVNQLERDATALYELNAIADEEICALLDAVSDLHRRTLRGRWERLRDWLQSTELGGW